MESTEEIIARIEAAIIEGLERPPTGEFGLVLVRVGDLRRVLTELERRND